MSRDQLYVVTGEAPAGNGREMSLEEMRTALRSAATPQPIVFLPASEGMARVMREMSRMVPALMTEKTAERREARIEGILGHLLDFDPLASAEARIDAMNAELRRDFLADFPVVEAATVHARAGHGGTNKAQTAAAWRRAGRILGLPYAGRIVYPLFQFDDAGQPWPLLRPVLGALPADRTPWQRAFWLVGPNERLDGDPPIEAIRRGEDGVLEAARHAGEIAVG